MRDAAAAARGPSERRAAAIPAGRGRTGVGRDTAIPLDKTELPRPSLDRKPRGRPRGLADRGTRACRPIDRERREQDCVSEKQSERTWVLRLPARMARAGPAAPTAFAAVTRLAAAKPARRDRRRALIVDGARSEKCASTGLLTTPKHLAAIGLFPSFRAVEQSSTSAEHCTRLRQKKTEKTGLYFFFRSRGKYCIVLQKLREEASLFCRRRHRSSRTRRTDTRCSWLSAR